MSNQEDQNKTVPCTYSTGSTESKLKYPDSEEQGACGGEPYISISPGSNSVDNLSLEVQFEDESSRHPSELSSISYQNLVDDCEDSSIPLSRHESHDSTDSIPVEDSDINSIDITKECDLDLASDLSTQISAKFNDKVMSDASNMNTTTINGIELNVRSFKGTGLGKGKGEPTMEVISNKLEMLDNCSDVSSLSSVNLEDVDNNEQVKKRNSLEIRNNIPVIGEVKSYERDENVFSYGQHLVKPNIRKQSPGLACRVGDGSGGSGSDREGSSSERELGDKPVQISCSRPSDIVNPFIQKPVVYSSSSSGKEQSPLNSLDQDGNVGMTTISLTDEEGDDRPQHQMLGQDVENEYDYVKYARVHNGDSYVGMRLAYSNEEEADKRSSIASSNGEIVDITGELADNLDTKGSKNVYSPCVPQSLNEDSLTEIPLNTNDSILDEKQTFSLSPENTECDSVEVESVNSDDNRSTLGMPMVEDGLSSSQASDNEDYISAPPSTQAHKSPTAMLRHKQKTEVEQEMVLHEMNRDDSLVCKTMDAEAIMEDLKAKREALDIAISDIKTAIQNSKGLTLKSPVKSADEEAEPIWVKRDSVPKEGSTPPIPSKSSPGVSSTTSVPTDTYTNREASRAYPHNNDKERLLDSEHSRSESMRHTPKGYDSDDDDDESGVRYSRRMKGKKYASLPKDDSFDHTNSPQAVNGMSTNQKIAIGNHKGPVSGSGSYSARTERANNSGFEGSDSEDYDSDIDPQPNTTYVKKQTGDFDTDDETDVLLGKQYQKDQYVDIPELTQPPVNRSAQADKRRSRAKEASLHDPENPEVLIEGVLFRARYLGSTQLISEGQPSKAMRMMQAQEAVGRIKTLGSLHFGNKFQVAAKAEKDKITADNATEKQAPEGENQPSTAVDLFVSTEKIMVLNTDLQEIMMDHTLRTVSYIADIGDILVIMARRRLLSSPGEDNLRKRKQTKILCHVFESEEAGYITQCVCEAYYLVAPAPGSEDPEDPDQAQLIAQSIGQAFQVAYMEFLKANGIEDPGLMKEIDYQDVLNQQEIYGEELNLFSNKELHKEVIVPKQKNEPLGIVIVESGWGSMVPTVVLANMNPMGPAARCSQLNIGDQIISINGISLVGLPLSACQTYIKNVKSQTVVKLTVVPCPPVVEVLIKRPDVKYQLGFSVQNGVICSLLRGGIAERGGVRVGHRIIEINSQSVVAVPHEKIVSLLANSVGEIHMKTMPTSIFRLLTGQETPHYL